MKLILKINPKAHEDIQSIYDYIRKDGLNIAKKQTEFIYESLENLSEQPLLGGELCKKFDIETDYRYLIVNSTYIGFYKVTKTNVEVYRVLDGRQDYLRILKL